MDLHARVGYVHDRRGNLLRANDWTGRPAPQFWLGRTPLGVLWRFRYDVPPGVRAEIERLATGEPRCDGENRIPLHDAAYRELLTGLGAAVGTTAGPTYRQSEAVGDVGGTDVLLITAANRHLLSGGLEAWVPDVPHQQPMVASVVAGAAVSICASVRITGEAHAAGVESVPAHRRQGHAAATVARWAREVTARGCIALYSTSWDNIASQRVAARTGFEMFGQEYRVG